MTNNKLNKLFFVLGGITLLYLTSNSILKSIWKYHYDIANDKIIFHKECGVKYILVDDEKHSLDSKFVNNITMVKFINEDFDMFKKLVLYGCHVCLNNIFICCCKLDEFDEYFIEYLLDNVFNVNTLTDKGDMNGLIASLNKGCLSFKKARLLLKKGINVNFIHEDTSALNIACSIGDIPLVKLLMSYGADPNNYKDVSPLSIAICNGNKKLTDLLLKEGANPSLKIKYKGLMINHLHHAVLTMNLYAIRLLKDGYEELVDEEIDSKHIINVLIEHIDKEINSLSQVFNMNSIEDAKKTRIVTNDIIMILEE